MIHPLRSCFVSDWQRTASVVWRGKKERGRRRGRLGGKAQRGLWDPSRMETYWCQKAVHDCMFPVQKPVDWSEEENWLKSNNFAVFLYTEECEVWKESQWQNWGKAGVMEGSQWAQHGRGGMVLFYSASCWLFMARPMSYFKYLSTAQIQSGPCTHAKYFCMPTWR